MRDGVNDNLITVRLIDNGIRKLSNVEAPPFGIKPYYRSAAVV